MDIGAKGVRKMLVKMTTELLNSINNFLDETVVLPPGDWDRKNLLSMSEIHELKRKKRLRIQVSISLTFYEQLSRTKIPKGKKG